ncbi:hypothetical protein V7793_02280 [Streptomyces sp. KLMMK]|uniref:hypothetical protein n=1 Tax=Streptomyces sp. KLMMK TaxID=3109353 RepID=UPI003000006E
MSSPTGREKVRYTDGRESVIGYTSSTVVRLSTVTLVILNGTVTEGRGQGRTA